VQTTRVQLLEAAVATGRVQPAELEQESSALQGLRVRARCGPPACRRACSLRSGGLAKEPAATMPVCSCRSRRDWGCKVDCCNVAAELAAPRPHLGHHHLAGMLPGTLPV